ncbi:MAG TPA: hypothetical protein VI603_03570 [Saprospiraceae bacterium]|nr:hypothetical protein [Saprospiraceae bacterium]
MKNQRFLPAPLPTYICILLMGFIFLQMRTTDETKVWVSQNPNDPWNQNFPAFKTAYQNADANAIANGTARPGFSIFNKNDLQNLINLPNVSYVVLYTIECCNITAGQPDRKTVAIAIDNGNPVQRVFSNNLQYLVPIHNCPPDCETDNTNPQTPLLDQVNPRYLNIH